MDAAIGLGNWLIRHKNLKNSQCAAIRKVQYHLARGVFASTGETLGFGLDAIREDLCRSWCVYLSEKSLEIFSNYDPIPDYFVQDGGIVTTVDCESGQVLKRARLREGGKKFYASPVAADGKIFIMDTGGQMTVLRAGAKWEVLATSSFGEPCFARARGSSAGPGTAWYYMKGAGPVFDLAVYPLTQLTALLGPVRRVAAFSGLSIPARVLKNGKRIQPTEDDNTQMLLDFGNSIFASCDATFVVKGHQGPWLELFGSEGALSIWRDGLHMWVEVYHEQPAHNLDGWVAARRPRLDHVSLFALGLEELVNCIRLDREPRIGGTRARHTLEIMLAAYESARQGRTIELRSSF